MLNEPNIDSHANLDASSMFKNELVGLELESGESKIFLKYVF